ncbi:FG-GAP and VCBS repeat-containing protein [Streptomyces spectabilis]|uniref:FG-GAP and VCBS repeat-containing protein n=1 Tax=Streptomyces spectabilis TaxID=68270 RepID=UPI0013782F5F|nr:FG-GAP and VCBS repeat-containing protein [Streptomyces spectabilis]
MRKKTLSAAVLCAATVIGVSGLSVASASAAGPAPRPKADFNGDGYADLAVGVPGATVGGKAKAGYVNVVWGGKNGLGKHGSSTVSQDTAGVPGNAEKGDGFGRTVVPADMNGDGITDIVVGTPDEDDGTKLSAGTVTVLWGSKSGIKGGFTAAKGDYSDSSVGAVLTTGDFDGDGKQDIVLNTHFDESSSLMLRPGPFKAGSPARLSRVDGWHFGGPRVVTTGDFDGNGRDDLAVAYGGMEDLGTKVLSRTTGEWKTQWSTGEGAGALAAGDFDGDGTTDLALGRAQPNPEAEEPGDKLCQEYLGGAIATVYGKKDTTLGGPVACTTQDSPQVGGTAEIEDDFGASLAVANLDRDGVDELIAGADTETVGTAKNAGSYWTLASAGTGKPFVGPSLSQNSAGVPGTAEAGDRFGADVATGDFNGDGYPDTAVGAPGEDAAKGGVWYARTPKDGPNPAQISLTPGTLGLSGAHTYGSVLGR